VKNSAALSDCRRYRYALWRTWDDTLPRVMFIGLNPSTADEKGDDPTLRRTMDFARRWGFGGVGNGNLFAYRATDPKVMMAAEDPVGRENDRWLKRLAADAGLVVAAWGNDGGFRGRSAEVRRLLPDLHCLKLNASGEPAHPLYQRADTQPRPLRRPAP
jgi:hypothetical protein